MTGENQSNSRRNIQSKREGFWSTKLESGMMQTERAMQTRKNKYKKKTNMSNIKMIGYHLAGTSMARGGLRSIDELIA
jgi:hypothetical protein